MKSADIYSVDRVLTLTLKLKISGYEETIQCKVLEHLDSDPWGGLVEMKVNQIIDFTDYLEGRDVNNFRERVIRVNDIIMCKFLM
jgi:hypothetical protein